MACIFDSYNNISLGTRIFDNGNVFKFILHGKASPYSSSRLSLTSPLKYFLGKHDNLSNTYHLEIFSGMGYFLLNSFFTAILIN